MLRKCPFAYSFPHLSWIFSFYSYLPNTQREALDRKFRVAFRIVHRCPYVPAEDLFLITKEKPLKVYAQSYIKKRLEKMNKSDLGKSPCFEDIFYWDDFKKSKKDSLGHFFRLKRVKKLIDRHETLMLKWINFVN